MVKVMYYFFLRDGFGYNFGDFFPNAPRHPDSILPSRHPKMSVSVSENVGFRGGGKYFFRRPSSALELTAVTALKLVDGRQLVFFGQSEAQPYIECVDLRPPPPPPPKKKSGNALQWETAALICLFVYVFDF
jgi:hypothetical protein